MNEQIEYMEPLVYALAGLLHDIGKFGQRAEKKGMHQSTYLSETAKNLVGQLCRDTQDGYYTHQHVLWTYEFVEKYKSKFQQAGLIGSTPDDLINLSAYHHRPGTDRQGIITLADWCSSGLDRDFEAVLLRNPDWKSKSLHRDIPLVSIFSGLYVIGQHIEEARCVYPVQKFSLDEQVFPKDVSEVSNNQSAYERLWKEFNDVFRQLPVPQGKPEAFIETIFHLLRLYSWYMPASTVDYPNISLFEHSKITGAFAHCIASYWNKHADAFEPDSNHRLLLRSGHYPFKLWCCNISGIQKFIYNITNKSAVKSLKGRSLYIQLLLETIAREMLQEAGASIINAVYIAGGKFYLLLPNTEEVNNKIDSYYTRLQEKLWDEHKEHLSVYIAGIPFRMDKEEEKGSGKKTILKVRIDEDNKPKYAGDLWYLLEQRLRSERNSKLKHIFVQSENFYNRVFEAHGDGGDVKVCAVTGEEVEENKKYLLNKEDIEQGEGEEIYVSPAVGQQIRLGRDLMGHRYLIELYEPQQDAYQVGLSTYWILAKDLPTNFDHIKTILCVNEPDFVNVIQHIRGSSIPALGFRLYGGAQLPQVHWRIKTLEEIAKNNEDDEHEPRDHSFVRLGILRMDVDNLGNLFMKGFVEPHESGDPSQAKNKSSFSALTTLSVQFDTFFSGYLNTLRNSDEFKDHVIIVYSGGDDVFAVGRWDKIISFASQIRNDFRKFVCNREEISLSCGIVLVRPKFPISKAADMAGEAEEAAKNYTLCIDHSVHVEKNAINLFDISLNWEHEWPFVVACKDDLVYWVKQEILTKGILMKIFDWYTKYKDHDISWKWHAAYSLARIADSTSNDQLRQKIKNVCQQLEKVLLFGQYKSRQGNTYGNVSFHALVVSCRWAEFELRTY